MDLSSYIGQTVNITTLCGSEYFNVKISYDEYLDRYLVDKVPYNKQGQRFDVFTKKRALSASLDIVAIDGGF
jgi:hypothetical protein